MDRGWMEDGWVGVGARPLFTTTSIQPSTTVNTRNKQTRRFDLSRLATQKTYINVTTGLGLGNRLLIRIEPLWFIHVLFRIFVARQRSCGKVFFHRRLLFVLFAGGGLSISGPMSFPGGGYSPPSPIHEPGIVQDRVDKRSAGSVGYLWLLGDKYSSPGLNSTFRFIRMRVRIHRKGNSTAQLEPINRHYHGNVCSSDRRLRRWEGLSGQNCGTKSVKSVVSKT